MIIEFQCIAASCRVSRYAVYIATSREVTLSCVITWLSNCKADKLEFVKEYSATLHAERKGPQTQPALYVKNHKPKPTALEP